MLCLPRVLFDCALMCSGLLHLNYLRVHMQIVVISPDITNNRHNRAIRVGSERWDLARMTGLWKWTRCASTRHSPLKRVLDLRVMNICPEYCVYPPRMGELRRLIRLTEVFEKRLGGYNTNVKPKIMGWIDQIKEKTGWFSTIRALLGYYGSWGNSPKLGVYH